MIFNMNQNPHIQALQQPFQPPNGAHVNHFNLPDAESDDTDTTQVL